MKKMVLLFTLAQLLLTALPAQPRIRWSVGGGDASYLQLRNVADREVVMRLFFFPERGDQKGVITPPLRLRPTTEMKLNLRHFLDFALPKSEGPASHSVPLRGALRIEQSQAPGSVVILLHRRQGREQEPSVTDLTLMGEPVASLASGPRPVCEGLDCQDGDPEYRLYDTFEYKEWDATGDGISDPQLESSMVVFDSYGNITFSDSISQGFSFMFEGAYHDTFCGGGVPIGDCQVSSCTVQRLTSGGETIYTSEVNFLTLTTCPTTRFFRIFDFPEKPVTTAQALYDDCLNQTGTEFNTLVDNEHDQAVADITRLGTDLGGTIIISVVFGGIAEAGTANIIKGILKGAQATVVWDALRSFQRAAGFESFVLDRACDWFAQEERCAIEANRLFDSDLSVRRNTAGINDVLAAKNISLTFVNLHCSR